MAGKRIAFVYCVFCTCACGASDVARAVPLAFQDSNITGSFDTTLSVGAIWRVERPSGAQIGIANGGTARSVNGDDGNLNFAKGDTTSAVAKATHDLEMRYKGTELFIRGTYFYDTIYRDKIALGPSARNLSGAGAKFLDAYVKTHFELPGQTTATVRLGNQVLNWGESLFIQNGINVINPINVAALRIPGSELKEALVPSPMAHLALSVGDRISVEAFVLANFDKTEIDPRGTFFSANDTVSVDGDKVYVGFGRRNDQHSFTPNSAASIAGWVPRASDRHPNDSGQYGFAAHYLWHELNDTEVGLYYINYHSRLPIVSGVRGTHSLVPGGPSARYFAEYPKDVKLYGLSVNTQGPFGVALAGELAYRPNLPMQLAAAEVLLAAVGLPNQITGTAFPAAALAGDGRNAANAVTGSEISGYRRLKVSQAQVSAVKAFGPRFGAGQWTGAVEVGVNRIHGLPQDVFLNAPGTVLPATVEGALVAANGARQSGGFMTKSSWGYRVLTRLDFFNVFGSSLTVSPRLSFAHDVHGTGPNFLEGAKAVTVGMTAVRKEVWQLDLAYTRFWGGRSFSGVDVLGSYRTDANPLADRDNITFSLSYSF